MAAITQFFQRLSIKWRLTYLFTAGMTLFLLFLIIFVYWSTASLVTLREEHLLQQKAKAIASDLQTELTEESFLHADYLRKLLTNYSNKHQAIVLLDSQDNPLASVIGTGWDVDPLKATENLMITEKPVIPFGFRPPMYIRVIESNKQLEPYLRILLLILTFASIGTLLVSILGGFFLSKLGLQPLNRLIYQIRHIHPSQISTRLPTKNVAAEIHDLVIDFNSMLDRVESALKRQRQFIADASHEFRTPLAIIEGYVRLLKRWGKDKPEIRDEALTAMQYECQRLFHLIDDMLALAKSRHATTAADGGREEQSLVPLLEEVKHAWTTLFPKHLTLTVQWSEPLRLTMEKSKIRRLIDILLDNARKYTEAGTVTLNAYAEKGWVHIEVTDTGIGIPKEEVKNVFQRFYRIEKSRNRDKGGSGLGLSIAQSIVEEYSGTIKIRQADEGGTIVHVALPSVQPREDE